VRLGASSATAIAAMLLIACGPRKIDLPFDRGVASAILLIERSPAEVWANDLEGSRGLAQDLPDGAPIALLGYADRLERHHLAPGRLFASEPGEPARSLPPPTAAYRLAPSNDGWTAIEAQGDDVFRSFRFRGDTPFDCVSRQGCFSKASEAECFVPCPEPPPANPPRFAVRPDPPDIACRAGWTPVVLQPVADASQTYPMCAPFSSGVPNCPKGRGEIPGAAVCTTIGSACPLGDGFPDPAPAGRTIYVRSGAQGGDGERPTPFGSISSASGRARTGDSIVLAPGAYSEDVVLPAGVELRGACASTTTIAGSIEVTGTSTISDLALAPRGTADLLHVGPSGRVSLGGVRFVGAASRVSLAEGASGSIATSAFEGSGVAIDLQRSAALAVEASTIRAQTIELGGDPSARLSVSDSVTHALISAHGASIEARGVVFLGRGVKLLLEHASAAVDQSSFEAPPGSIAHLVEATSGQFQATRTRFFTEGGPVLIASASTASISDSIISTRTSTFAMLQLDATPVVLSRTVFDMTNGRALVAYETQSVGPRPLTELRSTAVYGGGGVAIEVKGRVALKVRGLLIQRHKGLGISAIQGGGVEPLDTDLEDIRIVSSNAGIRVSDGRRACLARVFTRGLETAALEVNQSIGRAPMLDATDLDFAMPMMRSCDQGIYCTSAIAIEDGHVGLTRFAIDGSEIGVAISNMTGVTLSQGIFRNLEIGIAVFAAGTDLAPLIEMTRFENVGEGCGPCGR
jgi:hypothetical protein